jgi:hypothetical protein
MNIHKTTKANGNIKMVEDQNRGKHSETVAEINRSWKSKHNDKIR